MSLKDFTPRALRDLCKLHVTYAEIAAYFGIGVKTVEKRLEDPEYREAFESGQADGKHSLRRAQLDAALNGDRVMLIWMGKQLLGQREPEQRLEHTGAGGGAISYRDMPEVDRKRRMDELLARRRASGGGGESGSDRKKAAAAGRALVKEQAAAQVKGQG